MTSPRARSLPRTSDRDRGAGIHILHAKWRKATHSEPGVAARWPHGTPCPLSRPHHCCWGCGTKGGVVGEGADRGEGGPCSQTPWGEAADPCFLRYTAQTQNRKRPRLLPAGKARPLPPPPLLVTRYSRTQGSGAGNRLPAFSLTAQLDALGSSSGRLLFQSQMECDGGEDGDRFVFWPLICRGPFPFHTKLEGRRAGLLLPCHTASCYTSKEFWLKSKKHYPEKKANCE